MNPFLMSLPTILFAAVVLIFSLRIIRRVRINDDLHRIEHEKRMAELTRMNAERASTHAIRFKRLRADLVVDLDLADEGMIPDLRAMTEQSNPLVNALSLHERSLGGLGLALTQARVQPGSVRLTLSPLERTGSAERVRQVAEEWNAATTSLPPGVSSAHADILIA